MFKKTRSQLHAILLITVLSISTLSCAQEEPKSIINGAASGPFEFTDAELQRLDELRNDWKSLSGEFFISSVRSGEPTLNIQLDSVQQGPITEENFSLGGSIKASELAWTKEKDIMYFGIVGNNWRDRSLNKDLIYAVEKGNKFSIYNKKGTHLLCIPRTDTLNNGEVWIYEMSYHFVSEDKGIGCIILNRICREKNMTVDFRILTLSGEPLTSWKSRGPGSFDPYFMGYIIKEDSATSIVSTKGDTLYSCTSCIFKRIPSNSLIGVYRVFHTDTKRSEIITFEGKSKEVGYQNEFNIKYVPNN